MKKELVIGLIGLGTVGSGVWKVLAGNEKLIEERTSRKIRVKRVADKDVSRREKFSVPSSVFTTEASDILNDPEIEVVVELIGGTGIASDLVFQAIEVGKHVVTANKALLAKRGGAIFSAARTKGVSIGFEASVAGGIPILKSIREGFIANHIQEIYGIINGTANFILTRMTDLGEDFPGVLALAQKEGYAERDPTLDIKGLDTAQKLSILLSLCYGVEPPEDSIFVEGIDQITPLDISFAKKLGFTIKLLAIAKEGGKSIEARVHPTMIPSSHPLADVKGVFNAIFLKGDAVGDSMFMGRGAGMMPTASAVVSDIAMIANGLHQNWFVRPGATSLQKPKIEPMEELVSEYYLRFSVVDKPGVLAQIAKHLGDQDISISNVYQEYRDKGSKVPIVIMTHEAKEKNIQTAISQIDNLKTVLDKTVLIRVQRF